MIENYLKSIRVDQQNMVQKDYYNHIPSIHSLEEIQFNENITFFVGENGTGKSTLLEVQWKN